MAVTIVWPDNHTSTESLSGTAFSRYAIGPAKDPTLYGGNVRGRYVRQSGSSGSETYRWYADEPQIVASPAAPVASFSYDVV